MNTLETMPIEQYTTAIDKFIAEAAQWDGSLPMTTFLETWAALDVQRQTVEIQAQIVHDRLVLIPPPTSSFTVHENRIRLDDRRELVITLVPPSTLNAVEANLN